MRSVGRHTGERAAEVKSERTGFPRRRVLLLAAGVTGTLVAWGVLVYAAIDFGQEARSGEPTAWVLLTLTTLGAAACLFVTLLLGARVLPLFQEGSQKASPRTRPSPPTLPTVPARPTRPPGGHRAGR
jgi:RsiW-degrading membrane proteinase PrsW (M82 family)